MRRLSHYPHAETRASMEAGPCRNMTRDLLFAKRTFPLPIASDKQRSPDLVSFRHRFPFLHALGERIEVHRYPAAITPLALHQIRN